MLPSKGRKIEIAELAEFIADDYCPEGLVDPIRIADKKGITYSFGAYGSAFDGLLEHLSGKFHVYINIDRLKHAYTSRARFTFAHELGHYFIDEHRNALASGRTPSHPSFTNFVSSNQVEREADFFAACLLLPEQRFRAACFRRKFNFNLLDELSKKYQTSLTSTAVRFAEIGNHPIMIVCAQKGKVKWTWSSSDFPFFRLRGRGPYSRVPEDTAAGEFFQTGAIYSDTQDVFAGDWFEVRNDQFGRRFYEHCLGWGDQTLSVLWED